MVFVIFFAIRYRDKLTSFIGGLSSSKEKNTQLDSIAGMVCKVCVCVCVLPTKH